MIKRIQKYLLSNHPILWNVRLVPMLFVLLAIHLVIFGIGYLSTNTDFNKTYYYSPGSSLGILYPVSILVCILLLIGWLIFYNRNNGFKNFYPRKVRQIYTEWILIFSITSAITFIPFTLTEGFIMKWKSVATITDAQDAMKTIVMAKVMIPNSQGNYLYETEYDQPIPIPQEIKLYADSLDLNLYDTEYNYESGLTIKGYTGPSLLFYKDYDSYYFYNNDREYLDNPAHTKIKNLKCLITWLKEGNTDSIRTIMEQFSSLQKKHNLEIDLTVEEWYKRIYNPPFFPVEKATMIVDYSPKDYELKYNYDGYTPETPVAVTAMDSDDISSTNYLQAIPTAQPHLQYRELEAGYEQIIKSHNYKDINPIILTCLCFALGISILIFSYRSTNGKSWLIALVATGILIFISSLIAIGLSESINWSNGEVIMMIILSLWIILFIVLLTKIIIKIINKGSKGRSNIYANILIWLTPFIIPFTYIIYMTYQDIASDYSNSKDEIIVNILWINIPAIIVAMYPISILVRNWKSIPDE